MPIGLLFLSHFNILSQWLKRTAAHLSLSDFLRSQSVHLANHFNAMSNGAEWKTSNNTELYKMSNSTEWKTIIDAVTHSNDVDAVKKFVNAYKPDLTARNSLGQTGAHIAAKYGNLNLIKYILDIEPSLIHVRDTWNQSVFHLALQKGALDCVKYLVTHHNASLFEPNTIFPGSGAIHIAAALGKLDVVKYLHEVQGIDANLKNDVGQLATFSAATFNHLPVVKYFVEETDANMTALDNNGDNILFVSAKKGNLTIPKYLLDERHIDFDIEWKNFMGETIVIRAAVFNNYEFVKYFVEEKHAQINISDNSGSTPLHEAASAGGALLVKYLVRKGAQIDAKDKLGFTPKMVTNDRKISEYLGRMGPLVRRRRQISNSTSAKWEDIFEAAEHGDLAAVKHYIEREGTVLNDANPKGETLVHIAARNANFEILNYMLDRAPSLITVKDMQTNSPLHLATTHSHLDVVKYLIDERKANLLESNYILLGNTVVHFAAETGNLTMLKYFIEEKRIDVDIRNDLGWTPAFSAASKSHLHALKYLFEERNANVTVLDTNDDNILYVTAKTGNVSLVRYLLDEKKVYFDINWQDIFGETVVKRASRWGRLDLIKYLVDEKQADISLCDKNLRTPLHEAACIGYKAVMKFFLERGADPQAKDRWNRTHTDDDTYREVLNELHKMNVTLNISDFKRERRDVFVATSMPYCGALRPINGERDSSRKRENEVRSRFFDSFLVLAEVCVRYFRGSVCPRAADKATLSPREIIRQRMDPLVFDAIDSDFYRLEPS